MSATGEAPHRPGAQAGTTLIEALVVVTIAALVAMIGFPRLQQGLLTLSQRQTVSVVAARLREVRADALRSDRRLVFAISQDGRAFGASGEVFSRTSPGVEMSARPSGLISFYGDGSSSGGAVWVSAARRSVPIVVAPATGAVSVGAR
ncbi:MAG TPA: hypothetical protein VII63_10470 [Caulobacteraceae bacterium]